MRFREKRECEREERGARHGSLSQQSRPRAMRNKDTHAQRPRKRRRRTLERKDKEDGRKERTRQRPQQRRGNYLWRRTRHSTTRHGKGEFACMHGAEPTAAAAPRCRTEDGRERNEKKKKVRPKRSAFLHRRGLVPRKMGAGATRRKQRKAACRRLQCWKRDWLRRPMQRQTALFSSSLFFLFLSFSRFVVLWPCLAFFPALS